MPRQTEPRVVYTLVRYQKNKRKEKHKYRKQMAGGYDYNWTEDPPDELKCSICLSVARDPQQHGSDGCGKVFCTTCITEYQRNSDDCPNCRQRLTLFKDVKSTHSIKALKIMCSNHENGCEWGGELRYLEEHLKLRCEYAVSPCKYAEVGCDVHLLRKDLKEHEEDNQVHLQIMAERILELNKLVGAIKQSQKIIKITGFEERKKTNDNFFSTPFYTSPNGYKLCFNVDSNGSGDGLHTPVSVLMYLMKGDNDNSLTWPFTGMVTFELLNQLEDKNHHTKTVTFPADHEASKRVVNDEENIDEGYGDDMFISHAELISKAARYLKDDTLTFRVSIDCKLLETSNIISDLKAKVETLQAKTQVPQLKFKVTNFRMLKRSKSRFYSPAFYTSSRGYKMCICVQSEGANCTYVSVSPFLMKGDNDDSLTWPFTGTVTVELLNQLEDKNHRKVISLYTVDKNSTQAVMDGPGDGLEFYISHTDLAHQPIKNCQYLKDDTLYFRVFVEVPAYRSWLDF